MVDTVVDKLNVEIAKRGEFARPVTLPSIAVPTSSPDSMLASIKSIKTILDAREGSSGSILEKNLTLRDLIDAGAIEIPVGNRVVGALTDEVTLSGGGGSEDILTGVLSLSTTSQIFKDDALGVTTPSTITLTANGVGLTGTPVFSISSGTATLVEVDPYTFTINESTMSTPVVTVQCDWAGQTDYMSIFRLVDGADSLAAGLSNQHQGVACDSAGTVLAGQMPMVSQLYVARGSTILTSGVSYSVVSGSNVGFTTPTINSTTGVVSIAGITADSATVTFRATIGSATIDAVFTAAKTRNGATGSTGATGDTGLTGAAGSAYAQVSIFYRTATNVAPAVPTATLTWTFATSVLSGTLSSWSQTVPSATALLPYLWETRAMAVGPAGATTDTIATGEWATPKIVAQNGLDGTGLDGARGSVIAYVEKTSELLAWTARTGGRAQWCGDGALNETNAAYADASATLAATSAAGLANSTANLRAGDTVTQTRVSPALAITGYWDGAKWAHPGTYLNGNLLVGGSVVADAFATGSVGTITIANEAVTIPSGVTSATNLTVTTSWQILLQKTLNSGVSVPSQIILIGAIAMARATAGTSGTFTDIVIALCRHVTTAAVNTGGSEELWKLEVSKFYDALDVYTVPLVDNPDPPLAANTNYVYSLQIKKVTTPVDNTFQVEGSSFVVIGARR